MNPAEYERMFAHEDHNWWFVSRRELVARLIGRLAAGRPNSLIVDVGCGTGATASLLGQFGRVVGIDFSPLALGPCRERGISQLVAARAEQLPIEGGVADALVATDLIEHLDDDVAALREFRRVLKPGGVAVVTVPAYQMLWGEHDEALMHRRRYTTGSMRRAAEAAGFQTDELNHALCFLFPLALGRLAGRSRRPVNRPPEAQVARVPAPINRALIGLQRFESRVADRIRLPFGLSVVAVLRRPAMPLAGPNYRRIKAMDQAGIRPLQGEDVR
jgi:SAM-dependent methyltransferase